MMESVVLSVISWIRITSMLGSFRMTNFLMGKGFWEYIDGDQEEAPELLEEDPTAARDKGIQGMEPRSKEGDVLVVCQCTGHHDWAYSGCHFTKVGLGQVVII